MKSNTHLVTTLSATDEAGKVLRECAEALACSVDLVPMDPGARLEDSNARIAGAVLDFLGQKDGQPIHASRIGARLIDRALLTSACLPGRMERFRIRGDDGRTMTVVMDGAHVPFNLEAIFRDMKADAELAGPCVAVVGIGADKDALGLLSVLSRYVSNCVFTELPAPFRGKPCENLKHISESEGIVAEACGAISSAVERAIVLASKNAGWVLITGSLHLVGTARNLSAFR